FAEMILETTLGCAAIHWALAAFETETRLRITLTRGLALATAGRGFTVTARFTTADTLRFAIGTFWCFELIQHVSISLRPFLFLFVLAPCRTLRMRLFLERAFNRRHLQQILHLRNHATDLRRIGEFNLAARASQTEPLDGQNVLRQSPGGAAN